MWSLVITNMFYGLFPESVYIVAVSKCKLWIPRNFRCISGFTDGQIASAELSNKGLTMVRGFRCQILKHGWKICWTIVHDFKMDMFYALLADSVYIVAVF